MLTNFCLLCKAINMKKCIKCGIEKDFLLFHKDSSKRDGYKNICKKCRSKKKFRIRLSDNRKKFDKSINTSIYRAIKSNKCNKSWERLLGYKLEELKKHIEKQFIPEMNWKNFGSVWWIDKILPRSVFKYSNVNNNEFKKCWSLKNMRPLLKIDCIKKRDKVIWDLVDEYNLYGILPLGLIIVDKGGISARSIQKKENYSQANGI